MSAEENVTFTPGMRQSVPDLPRSVSCNTQPTAHVHRLSLAQLPRQDCQQLPSDGNLDATQLVTRSLSDCTVQQPSAAATDGAKQARSYVSVLRRISSLVSLAASSTGYRPADAPPPPSGGAATAAAASTAVADHLELHERRQHWLPDAVSKQCYDCGEKFTTFRRRHHCRVCGQIFCSRCCNHMLAGRVLGAVGQLRVCTYCCRITLTHVQNAAGAGGAANTDHVGATGANIISNSSSERSFDLRAVLESISVQLNMAHQAFGGGGGGNGGGGTVARTGGADCAFVTGVAPAAGLACGDTNVQRRLSSTSLSLPLSSSLSAAATAAAAAATTPTLPSTAAASMTAALSAAADYYGTVDTVHQDLGYLSTLVHMICEPIQGVGLRRHRHRLKSVSACLVASEMVDWLVCQRRCCTRSQAVAIGQRLVSVGLLECVSGGGGGSSSSGGAGVVGAGVFRDDYCLYRPTALARQCVPAGAMAAAGAANTTGGRGGRRGSGRGGVTIVRVTHNANTNNEDHSDDDDDLLAATEPHWLSQIELKEDYSDMGRSSELLLAEDPAVTVAAAAAVAAGDVNDNDGEASVQLLVGCQGLSVKYSSVNTTTATINNKSSSHGNSGVIDLQEIPLGVDVVGSINAVASDSTHSATAVLQKQTIMPAKTATTATPAAVPILSADDEDILQLPAEFIEPDDARTRHPSNATPTLTTATTTTTADGGDESVIDQQWNALFESMESALLTQLLDSAGLAAKWHEPLVHISRAVSRLVKPDVRGEGDAADIDRYMRVKRVAGGRPSDCRIVNGVVFSQCPDLATMRCHIDNPQILLINCPIAYERYEGRLTSLEPLVMQQGEVLRHIVELLVSLAPDIILVERHVECQARELLLRAGVTLMSNVKRRVMVDIARCTQASAMSCVDVQITKPALGICQQFYTCQYTTESGGSKTLAFIDGCASHLGCTVLLRGGHMNQLRRVKRVLRLMVRVQYGWVQVRSYLRCAGAVPPVSSLRPIGLCDESLCHNECRDSDTNEPEHRIKSIRRHTRECEQQPTELTLKQQFEQCSTQKDELQSRMHVEKTTANTHTSTDTDQLVCVTSATVNSAPGRRQRGSSESTATGQQSTVKIITDKSDPLQCAATAAVNSNSRADSVAVSLAESCHTLVTEPAAQQRSKHASGSEIGKQLAYDLADDNCGDDERFRRIVPDLVICTMPLARVVPPYLVSERVRDSQLRCFYPRPLYWSTELDYAARCRMALNRNVPVVTKCSRHTCPAAAAAGSVRQVWHPLLSCDFSRLAVSGRNAIALPTSTTNNNKNSSISPFSYITNNCDPNTIDCTEAILTDFRARGSLLLSPVANNSVGMTTATSSGDSGGDAAVDLWPPIGDCLSPFHHQRLAVITDTYCHLGNGHSLRCSEPLLTSVPFDSEQDVPLGALLERQCLSASVSPGASAGGWRCDRRLCQLSLSRHVQRHLYGGGCLLHRVRQLTAPGCPPISDDDGQNFSGNIASRLWLWTRCLRCGHTSPARVVCDDTWSLSFARFVEMFATIDRRVTASSCCPHSLFADRQHFVARGQWAVQFTYVNVQLNDVVLPPAVISIDLRHFVRRRVTEELRTVSDGIHVFGTVMERLFQLESLASSFSHTPLSPKTTTNDKSSVSCCLAAVQKALDDVECEKMSFRALLSSIEDMLRPLVDSINTCDSSAEAGVTDVVSSQSAACGNPIDEETVFLVMDRSVVARRVVAETAHKWSQRLTELWRLVKAMPAARARAEDAVDISKAIRNDSSGVYVDDPGKTVEDSFQNSPFSKHVSSSDYDRAVSSEYSAVGGSVESDCSHGNSVNVVHGKSCDDGITQLDLNFSACNDSAPFSVGDSSENSIDNTADGLSTSSGGVANKAANITVRSGSTSDDIAGKSGNGNDSIAAKSASCGGVVTAKSVTDSGNVAGSSGGTRHKISSTSSMAAAAAMRIKSLRSTTFSNSELANIAMLPPLGSNEHFRLPPTDPPLFVSGDDLGSIIAYSLLTPEYASKIDSASDAWSPTPSASASGSAAAMGASSATGPISSQLSGKQLAQSHVEVNLAADGANFYCQILMAQQFRRLRSVLFPGDDGEQRFVRSLCQCKPWHARGGKSGSTFQKSLDDRLIIKTVSRVEKEHFVRFAASYVDYVLTRRHQGKPSALAKIVGVFFVGYRNNTTGSARKAYTIVMENLFYGRQLSQKFDLKGSLRNRMADVSEPSEAVLMDQNVVMDLSKCPLYVHTHAKRVLMCALASDTQFLQSCQVMDYSLLAGVDSDNKCLVVGIIDYLRSYTYDKAMETYIKSYNVLLGDSANRPTVLDPLRYRARFLDMMNKYFTDVPDRWFGFDLRAHLLE